MKANKHIYSVLFLCLLFASNALNAKEINILFMGNSFTFRHDLPELVKTVFEEGQPGLTVNVERITYGGQDMFRHHDLYFSQSLVRLNSISVSEIEKQLARMRSLQAMSKVPDFYKAYWERAGIGEPDWENLQSNHLMKSIKHQEELIERIKNRERVKWDYLVLQSWKDVVDDVDKGYAEYAQKWAKIAKKEGIQVILYITAPHAQNAQPVDGPMELVQTDMEMKTVQKLVDRINPRAVVPVALGIKQVQSGGTDLKFRYINDGHPNQYGAFLTSNMFYAAFFGESTEGFDYNTVIETKLKDGKDPDGGDKTVVLDENTKKLLQKAAYDAVMEFKASE